MKGAGRGPDRLQCTGQVSSHPRGGAAISHLLPHIKVQAKGRGSTQSPRIRAAFGSSTRKAGEGWRLQKGFLSILRIPSLPLLFPQSQLIHFDACCPLAPQRRRGVSGQGVLHPPPFITFPNGCFLFPHQLVPGAESRLETEFQLAKREGPGILPSGGHSP